MQRSLGTARNAAAGDGERILLRRHETECRADDGGHGGHLADIVRPPQPSAAARLVLWRARWSAATDLAGIRKKYDLKLTKKSAETRRSLISMGAPPKKGVF